MARRESRRERERRARRLWRHYRPPAPDEVEPDVDPPSGWTTYRARKVKLPPVAKVPIDQTTARTGKAWMPPGHRPPGRRTPASNPYDADAGTRIVRGGVVQILLVTALIGGGVVYGIVDIKDDHQEPPDPPPVLVFPGEDEPLPDPGPDPRTAAGLEHIAALLDAELGDDRVIEIQLRAHDATIGILRRDGRVDLYAWDEIFPDELDLFHTTDRVGGTLIDLDKVDAAAFSAPLARLRSELGGGPDDGEVRLFHAPGSRQWAEITVYVGSRTGEIRTRLDGTVISDRTY